LPSDGIINAAYPFSSIVVETLDLLTVVAWPGFYSELLKLVYACSQRIAKSAAFLLDLARFAQREQDGQLTLAIRNNGTSR
jgi:hypothetical protein